MNPVLRYDERNIKTKINITVNVHVFYSREIKKYHAKQTDNVRDCSEYR